MKYFVAFLFCVMFTATGEYAFGTEPKQPTVQPDASAGLGDDTTLLHRPTPPPSASSSSSAPKEKKPITAILTKEEKGKTNMTTFTPSDTVRLLWQDPTGAKGDKIRVVWYAVDTGKVFPKKQETERVHADAAGTRRVRVVDCAGHQGWHARGQIPGGPVRKRQVGPEHEVHGREVARFWGRPWAGRPSCFSPARKLLFSSVWLVKSV